jgi:hypothetical protein
VAVLRASKKFDPEKGVDFANHRTDILRVSDVRGCKDFPFICTVFHSALIMSMIAGTVIRP